MRNWRRIPARMYAHVPHLVHSDSLVFQLDGRVSRLGREMDETIGGADDSLTRQIACVVCDPLIGRKSRFHAAV